MPVPRLQAISARSVRKAPASIAFWSRASPGAFTLRFERTNSKRLTKQPRRTRFREVLPQDRVELRQLQPVPCACGAAGGGAGGAGEVNLGLPANYGETG